MAEPAKSRFGLSLAQREKSWGQILGQFLGTVLNGASPAGPGLPLPPELDVVELEDVGVELAADVLD